MQVGEKTKGRDEEKMENSDKTVAYVRTELEEAFSIKPSCYTLEA